MTGSIDFIKDINERYCSLEFDLEKKLRIIEADELKFEAQNMTAGKSVANEFESCPSSLEAARKRNRKIIEDLEQARAFLRSRVIYSPLEAILEKARKNYFSILDAPVRKKYGPVFV